VPEPRADELPRGYCPPCVGTGSIPLLGVASKKCDACNGIGRVPTRTKRKWKQGRTMRGINPPRFRCCICNKSLKAELRHLGYHPRTECENKLREMGAI
jgi:hypothetical protein